MIDVNVKITDIGIKKLSKQTYDNVRSELVENVGDQIYKYIMSGGSGVRFHYPATGGVPIWEDDPALLAPEQNVGDLRRSHYKRMWKYTYKIGTRDPETAWNVIEGMRSPFWQTVRGSSPSAGKINPYHKRSVDTVISMGVIDEKFHKAMQDEGIL